MRLALRLWNLNTTFRRVMIFPTRNSNYSNDSVALYLQNVIAPTRHPSQDWSQRVSFSFEFINFKDPESSIKKSTKHSFTKYDDDWGWHSWMSRDALLSENAGWTKDGRCQIRLSLELLPKSEDEADASRGRTGDDID
eukprot:Rmarinus@m.5545